MTESSKQSLHLEDLSVHLELHGMFMAWELEQGDKGLVIILWSGRGTESKVWGGAAKIF